MAVRTKSYNNEAANGPSATRMLGFQSTLCCPVCHGRVDGRPDGYLCPACGRLYPLVLGIPDFRVSLPAHFDQAKDLELARALAEAEKDLDFDGLLRLCMRLYPKASDLQEKHLAHLAGEADQARTALDLIEQRRPLEPADAILEVGCGLGQYLAIAAERVDRVAGVDLCLRYLVLTRKRLHGRGVVLAAEAERLPFRDGGFGGVIAADVIEHLADPQRALAEMGRVLAPGAPLFLSTPNRFSLTPEPHVGLWGVGYLPRRWANGYVRRRRKIFYDDVRLLSAASLGRLLRAHFPGPARILIPGLSPRQMEYFPPLKRRLARCYQVLRRWPLARSVFYLFGPFFQVVAVKR